METANVNDIFATNTTAGVRQIQKQVNNELSSTKQKLRGLVSARYRDLLSTAETIIEMDTDMHRVSDVLGEIVRGCDSRAVAKRARGVSKLGRPEATSEQQSAVQLQLLRLCPVVVKGLVRQQKLLPAAKTLVLARLLAKGMDGDVVAESRARIGRIRTALLRRIDGLLATSEDREQLLGGMCAYAIVANGSGRDVLDRFLSMRLERVRSLFAADLPIAEKLLQAEQSMLTTMDDVKALAPKKLITALEALSTSPLLRSKDMRDIVELRLDRRESLLGSDVVKFTFYTRTEGLTGPELRTMLSQWRKAALASFVSLSNSIIEEKSFAEVVTIREKVLQTWIDAGPITGEIASLQNAFLTTLKHLIDVRAAESEGVLATIDLHLQSWSLEAQASLWDPEIRTMDVSDGAMAFREAIYYRSHGLGRREVEVLTQWKSWTSNMANITAAIKDMERNKWASADDSSDDDADDDSEELAKLDNDPTALQEHLQAAVNGFERASQAALTRHAKQLQSEDTQFTAKASYLVRLLREAFPMTELASELNKRLATSIAAQPLLTFTDALSRSLKSSSYPARPLWSGEPERPSLPSKQLFSLLRNLSSAMTAAGADLWTAQAVDEIRGEIRKTIDGIEEPEDGDYQKQWTFDKAFLEFAYSHDGEEGKGEMVAPARAAWERMHALFPYFS